tara:strand:+ start:8707 stop:10035 length:1329 start_codon:yes stop_codon:yes gene_type:complete
MGIIKKILLLSLFICASDLIAQVHHDTIYFSGRKFVKHVVKGGESLRSIADHHQVKVAAIKDANELERRLYYNQLLYIPIGLQKQDRSFSSKVQLMKRKVDFDTSVTNVALLMPYYLRSNDIISNDNEDTLGISDRFYPKSESALSFHVGVELAIDSLRKLGKNIVLYTFDTDQDSLEVSKIVYSDKLHNMDVIIGPMHSHLFQIVCRKYGNDPNKILISPLSRENKDIIRFSSVYQIALTHQVQSEILINFLMANKSEDRIIIIHDEKERRLAGYSRNMFLDEKIIVESFEINNLKMSALRDFLVDHQNILLLSKEKTFISTILGAIGSIDSSSTVFSFESIMSYDNLDITNLMELDVHIPNSRSIDPSSRHDLIFLLSFEDKFQTNPGKYTKQGYDIIMHFIGSADLYNFKKIPNGYHENISGPIFYYSDFKLINVQLTD